MSTASEAMYEEDLHDMENSVIASLKKVNASLLKELEDKDSEIDEMRKQLEELVNDDDEGIKDKKILELAKKVRHFFTRPLFCLLTWQTVQCFLE